MTQYATTTDLVTFGMPVQALGQLTVTQQNAALERASEEADSYLRGRYPLPLLSWGTDLTEVVCKIATWRLLSVRGFNPGAGADVAIRQGYDDAITWLRRVQMQQAHPNVTPAATPTASYGQPTVISSSVVDARGAVAPNRGW